MVIFSYCSFYRKLAMLGVTDRNNEEKEEKNEEEDEKEKKEEEEDEGARENE